MQKIEDEQKSALQHNAQAMSAPHTVAFVTAKDSWINVPSADLAREHFPEAEIRGLQGYDSLISGKRAEQVLGFVPEFSCRDVK